MNNSRLVVLNLGKGNCQQGFPSVTAQLWQSNSLTPIQFTGSLPPAAEIATLYQRWQILYQALYSTYGWCSRTIEIEIDEIDVTHISVAEFNNLSQELESLINQWLSTAEFRNIDRKLRTQLIPTEEIRLIIVAEDPQLLRFPWCLWHFLADYPQAEIALSAPEFMRSLSINFPKKGDNVKILAILGNSQGIDISKDQLLLTQLPHTEIKFLVEPNLKELNQELWESDWDILFFAGHSTSQGKGRIEINSQDSLTIEQLKYALKKAIAQGLQLAIFNSCDGLGLAWDLADLHLPQVIVMREPVPDLVAQEFLKHFLRAFSEGKSLYLSVREAREKLQAIENEFPCGTWLPVICQNPAEIPPNWHELLIKRQNKPDLAISVPAIPNLKTVLFNSIVITAIVIGMRWLAILQPLELWAFDQLLRLRPQENPDPRLLVVTITEKDIQSQGEEWRRGSLSDNRLNQLLAKLESYQPQAIGLDIYRDFPVSSHQQELKTRLEKSDRLIAICKRSDPDNDPTGIPPPPEIPESRLGFSDFLPDSDGILRRQLLFMTPNPVASPCTTAYAFSVQLAFRYLNAEGITPQFTPEGDLKLGKTVFYRLQKPTGGYQSLDTKGSQVLLNYRSPSPQKIASQVTLSEVLNGQINPKAVKNRIILIGVTANSMGDIWSTPYGAGVSEKMPGVFIQAQMLSQILSAVLDKRSLLWVWSQWIEVLWIWGWSLIGGILALTFHSLTRLGLTFGIAGGILWGLCLFLLIQGGWIPLVPSMLVLLVTGGAVAYQFLSAEGRRKPFS